jgi:hypothetical protein
MNPDATGRHTSGSAALRVVSNSPADVDPLATWNAAMPRELLSHPRLTGDARVLAAYLWALAGWQADALIRTTLASLATSVAMPESSVRDHMARLEREGYVSPITSRRGRPECGGGAEFVVYGPTALGERLRLNRPADTAQGRLPLAAADELVDRCRALSRDIDNGLTVNKRPHTVERWLVVAGALLGCEIPIELKRREGSLFGRVALTDSDIRSAIRAAARRSDPGKAYYFLLRDRLSATAGAPVRCPSQEATRAACENIEWPWRKSWDHSPRELQTMHIAAQADGDQRDYRAWLDALDNEPT